MSSRLSNTTIIIPPASGSGTSLTASCKRVDMAGAFFFCKASSAPFKMQYDAGGIFDCDAGFWDSGATFDGITFFNYKPYPISITLYVGASGVGYSGTLLSKNLETYIIGNLGLSANGNYLGGGRSQAITFTGTGNNYISVPSGGLTVFGVNAGNQRKLISLYCFSGNNLILSDPNGCNFAVVQPGQTLVYETCDTILLTPDLSASAVAIGEIYYKS